MLDRTQIDRLIGHDVLDREGSKIGSLGQIYLHDRTGDPSFATVKTGLFGTRESFVPLNRAEVQQDALVIPYEKDQVKHAPSIEADQHISEEEERRIFAHYEMDYDEGYDPDTVDVRRRGRAGRDMSGPSTDDAMTRSEEDLRVGTRTEETGRARLRKYVVTEQETVSVPVRKERAVIEREPITDADVGRATSGPDISDEEHEVVLNEERPVVEKTVKPVERVRLGKEEVFDEEMITEDVRRERIETEGDVEQY